MEMEKVKPIIKDKEGNIEMINLCCDAANADWLRAARLMEKAEVGDKKAKRELAKLEDTPMYYLKSV